MSIQQRIVVVAIVILSTACGGGVGGRYVGQGETLFNSLTFGDDGKVEMEFVGMLRDGTYVMEEDNIIVTAPNGDRVRLRPASNGCYSNEVIGTYCKDGSAPRTASAPLQSDGPESYEATAREGRILLEFAGKRNVRVTMTPNGGSDMPQRMSIDASYESSGDRITVRLPGGEDLMLTRAGTSLEGAMGGETVRFDRR
jgi:hypothetical protein